ncbi:Na+-transporting NADH:ubiquinone oxidoreductase, subunit NqrB, partial [Sphaerospermopsis sp. FACHB-1094]|nr:Na+-transporting NADH:ubiquinone oxidoreductase, subunit NqrB [Sphaerospermopsis sp. FACHB-1094]
MGLIDRSSGVRSQEIKIFPSPQSPVPSPQSPVPSHQSPVTSHQSPVTSP